MNNLQELCYKNIAKTVQNAPPILQEIIMGKTCQTIKEELKNTVKHEIEPEVTESVQYDFSEFLSQAVPEIIHTILKQNVTEYSSLCNTKRLLTEKYRGYNPIMIECAFKIAQNAINKLEGYYVNRAVLFQSVYDRRRNIPTRGFDRVDEEYSCDYQEETISSSDEYSADEDSADEDS